MTAPLDGIRVLDAAQGVAGPYCCRQLADAGADVTKAESGNGDMTGQWEPRAETGEAVAYRTLNRGKHRVRLDLENDADTGELEDLAAGCDVLVTDVDGPVAAALPYERARALNPGIVYCVISGYGPEGPWAGQPAGELAAQMATEFTSSLGSIGEPPVRLGTDIAGMLAGIHAVQAVTAALLSRLDTGHGDRIEVSPFGSLITMRSTLWVALSQPDEWWGFHLDNYVKPPFHGFPCRDGAIYIELRGVPTDERERMFADLGMGWAGDDPRYELLLTDGAGGSGRYTHELMDLWERGLAPLTCAEAIAIIERHGGVALPVNDFPAVLNSPQVAHLGIIREDRSEPGPPLPVVSSPWTFSSGSTGAPDPPGRNRA